MQGIERFLAKNKGKQTVTVPPPKTIEVGDGDGNFRQVLLSSIVQPQGGSGTVPAKKKPKPKKMRQHPSDKGRLPDGSAFVVYFTAATTTWIGTLTVGDQKFTDTASGVFKLLTKLDGMYRAWAAKGGGA